MNHIPDPALINAISGKLGDKIYFRTKAGIRSRPYVKPWSHSAETWSDLFEVAQLAINAPFYMQPAMLKAWQEAVKFYPYIDALGEKHYYDTNILIVKFYCARWRTGLMVHWSNPNHSYQWQFYPGKPINFPLPLISMISVKLAALKFMTFTNDEEHDLYWSIEATKQYGPKVKKAFPRMFRHIVTLPLEKEITFYTLDDAYKTAMQTLTIEPGKKIFFSYSIINANTGQRSPRYKKEFTPYEVL